MKLGAIGIDIGGTKTLCVLADDKHRVLDSQKFKTAATAGEKNFLHQLVKSIQKLQKVANARKLGLAGLGIACAGQVDCEALEIRSSPNLVRLEGCEIGEFLQRALGLKVHLRNDVQMGILAEYRLGAARGTNNALGIFFGTGVGSAAIINGHLHTGASGFGGQIGALLAQPVGGHKAALSHGIVDRIASKAAIAGEALVMAVKEWAPYLHKQVGSDLSKVTWGTLRRSVEHGDKRVEEMLRARLRVVGIAASNVVNFMNPDVVVLGGGLVDAFSKLAVKEFERGLREHLVPEVDEVLKVREAELGKEAAALGACCVALGETSELERARQAA